MGNFTNKKPIKVLKTPMALHDFIVTKCRPTPLEVKASKNADLALCSWWRIYEWCDDGSLIFVRECHLHHYEVYQVESLVGVRLAA